MRNDVINKGDFLIALARRKASYGPMEAEIAFGYIQAHKDVLEILKEMPNMDVETVVRCKDCKHASPMYYEGRTVWSCRWSAYLRNEDHYCKMGERRAEE